MAKHFSIRVSSKDQNYARQLAEAKKYADIPPENIWCDKISGRKKERPNYDKMKSVLKKGDEVYFMDIDRIGRSKELIKGELKWFRENGIIVRVLSMPTTLTEWPEGQEWVMEMVNNILIEVLSTIAEQEWEKTTERRKAGIAAMPIDENGNRVSSRTGRGFGRPATEVEVGLLPGETVDDACERLGISRATYYRKAKAASVVS